MIMPKDGWTILPPLVEKEGDGHYSIKSIFIGVKDGETFAWQNSMRPLLITHKNGLHHIKEGLKMISLYFPNLDINTLADETWHKIQEVKRACEKHGYPKTSAKQKEVFEKEKHEFFQKINKID